MCRRIIQATPIAAAALLFVFIGAASKAGAYSPNTELVVGTHANGIFRFDFTTKALIDNFGSVSAWDIEAESDGVLLVADKSVGQVVRYDGRTGDSLGVLIPHGSGGLGLSYGVKTGPDGKLYVADYVNQHIKMYDPHTGAFLSDFAPATPITPPERLEFDSQGRLYSSQATSPPGIIYQWNAAGSITHTMYTAASENNHLWAMVARPDGYLYASSENVDADDSIVRFDLATGNYAGTFIQGLTSETFGMAFGPDGNLYVAASDGKINEYNGTTGAFISEFADLTAYGGDTVRSMAIVAGVPEPTDTCAIILAMIGLKFFRRPAPHYS